MILRSALLAVLLLAVPGCRPVANDAHSRAKQAADAYIRETQQPPELLNDKVTVVDAGPHWAVTYHIPEVHAGGDFIVWIDKRTMKGTDHIGWQ